MALDLPVVFDQLYYDMELACADKGNGWRLPGERAESARDRLRREREEIKRRYAVPDGVPHD